MRPWTGTQAGRWQPGAGMTSEVPVLTVFGPGDVRLERRAELRPAAGELLVEPDLVGLCGTDLEIIDGTIDPAYVSYPIAIGHEWTGIVTGDSPLAGRRVVVEACAAPAAR